MRDGFAAASVTVAGGRVSRVERGVAAAGSVRLPEGAILAPGFIDAQVNGGGGVLFNDAPTAETLRTIVDAQRAGGTTGLLPTLITDAPGQIEAAAGAVREARASAGSGILGLHLEGPFISPARPGVHDGRWIRALTADDLALLTAMADEAALGALLVTLAPEEVSEADLLALSKAGTVLAAGHTEARPTRTMGVRGFTHLWNAMPPIKSRVPGPVAACLANERAWCGVIADGIHVDPVNLKLTLRCKPGRAFLVSDSMPVAGTEMTGFILQGRPIHRTGGRLVTADGTLAGADLSMIAAVRNVIDLTGATLEDALSMASSTPADFLRMPDRGRIEAGAWADLVVLSSALHVIDTAVEGCWRGGRGGPTVSA